MQNSSEMEQVLDEIGFKPDLTIKKRQDYLDWDEYFLAVSILSSQRSKDPNTQVGACIVNEENKIVGIGYNGFPKNCSDDLLPWSRSSPNGSILDTKYPFVCHAEMNAILNKNEANLKNCTIYVSMFPCNDCAKLIIQSGIKRVVFLCDKYAHTEPTKASKIMFKMAGIQIEQFKPKRKRIVIDFSTPEIDFIIN
ncbi:deoxycytidylate deaminase [Brachionus plicatilis]|uniref:dCMP deaminase n=1 Tax=Brachionus plicatilis TaxID=10195 RepID=A0A3M7QZ47_BRAPC|nr:deoxycytidylate deaminase [Brachionus plicatilis]RNA16279.1 deoxycytidylate deaminase [Brachionus plicatilis]